MGLNENQQNEMERGNTILSDLQFAVSNLPGHPTIVPILATAQEFIDAYSTYLQGFKLNKNFNPAKDREHEVFAREHMVDDTPYYDDADLLKTDEELLLALDISSNLDCNDEANSSQQACQIKVAWERLVRGQFASLKASLQDITPSLTNDEWQFVWDLFEHKLEIEKALEALFNGEKAERLRDTITNVFGFEIEMAYSSDDWIDWEDELLNLLIANLHVAAFFQELIADTGLTGLEVFKRLFAQNPDSNPIEILLGGANPYMGRVPLPGSTDVPDELRRMQLGEAVSVATIVHELGHQFDRWFKLYGQQTNNHIYGGTGGVTGYLDDVNENNVFGNLFEWTRTGDRQDGRNLDRSLYTEGIIMGFGGKQLIDEEVFADLFMTSVLADQEYQIFSITNLTTTDIGLIIRNYPANVFIECGERNLNASENPILPCGDVDVAWGDTDIAARIREALRVRLFLPFLEALKIK